MSHIVLKHSKLALLEENIKYDELYITCVLKVRNHNSPGTDGITPV